MCRAAFFSSPVRPDPEPPPEKKGLWKGPLLPRGINRSGAGASRCHREVQSARAALVGLGAGAVAVLFQKALSRSRRRAPVCFPG